jgi:hypothetical protein
MAILDHQSHKVYTRFSWADAWEQIPNLFADTVMEAASPRLPRATFSYRFGNVKAYNAATFATVPRIDYLNWYVKVEISQPDGAADRIWYGVITEESISFDGDEFGIKPEQGTQNYTAFGLEYLLTRKVIDSSVVRTATNPELRINRAIAFNAGQGTGSSTERRGNQTGFGALGFQVFAESLDEAIEWDAFDIIHYLLKFHEPTDAFGTGPLLWSQTSGSQVFGLRYDVPVIHTQGKTVKQILDQLINKRRGVGWHVVVDEDAPQFAQIHVFSYNESNITTDDGTVIEANPNQTTWDIGTSKVVQQATLSKSASQQYDKVIARGEQRGSCFTLDNAENTLDADWTTALQTAYNAGGTGASGRLSKQDLNQLYRKTDKFKRVYRYFRVGTDWNGKVNANANAAMPVVQGFAGVLDTVSEPFWLPGLRFQPRLPLKSDHDYTGDNIKDGTVTDGTPAASEPEFLRPFATILDGTRNYQMDRMGKGDTFDTVQEAGGRQWSASLRMQDDQPGIIVDVQGSMQHAIANVEFAAADADDTSDFKADLDWHDMLITVFVLSDSFAEGAFPDPLPPTPGDQERTLKINVPGARLDYVAKATVVGIASDGTLLTTNGGFVQDDRVYLRELARLAYEWYSVQRHVIDVTVRGMDPTFTVDDLITSIGNAVPVTVNSVVTSITFDLRANTYRIETDFANLDVVGL